MANSQNTPDSAIAVGELEEKKANRREPGERIHWIGNCVLVGVIVHDPKGRGPKREWWWVRYEVCALMEMLQAHDERAGVKMENITPPRTACTLEEAEDRISFAVRNETVQNSTVNVSWMSEGREVASGHYTNTEYHVLIEAFENHCMTAFAGDEAISLIDAGIPISA